MTKSQIVNSKSFTQIIPKKIAIKAGTQKIILTNTLRDTEISLSKNSSLIFVSILKKGWEKTQTLKFTCKEENSNILFIALIIGQNKENFPFQTISEHNTKHTTAKYLVRGIMKDDSTADYKGILKIGTKGQSTNGYLSHHSLMLSENSKVTTTPCLEIKSNDVKAGHSATIGKIDKESFFYLNTRGIDKKTVEHILIQNFLEQDLKKIPDKKLRQVISKKINAEKI